MNRPPRGCIFTYHGPGRISRWIQWGQRVLMGRTPADGCAGASHTGICTGKTDDQGRDWIIDSRWPGGVTMRPLGPIERSYCRFWIPLKLPLIGSDDTERGLQFARGRVGIKYDPVFIVTGGRYGKIKGLVCSELVKVYLDRLHNRIGGWRGDAIDDFAPNDVTRYLREIKVECAD